MKKLARRRLPLKFSKSSEPKDTLCVRGKTINYIQLHTGKSGEKSNKTVQMINFAESVAFWTRKDAPQNKCGNGGLAVHVLKTRTTARKRINARVVTWSLKAQPFRSQRILKPSTPPSNFRQNFQRKAHADGTGGSHSVFGNPALTQSQRILKPSTLPPMS